MNTRPDRAERLARRTRPARRGGSLGPALLVAFAGVAASAAIPIAVAADSATLARFSSAAPGEPPAGWRFATLPRKTPTKFEVVELDGAHVLKVSADDSYGNLAYGLHVQSTDRASLSWKWRVDKLVDAADLTTRGGDDSAAKLCVFFAFDAGKLPFGERTKLSLARSASGEDVPTQTLCYVWDNKLAADTGLVNAFTKRIRFIVLESGTSRLTQWVPEKRSLAADYRRLFGDESDTVPEITGIAVSADADNTHGHGLAYFGDVELTP